MLSWMGQIQSRPGLPSHDVLEDLFDALTKPDELKAYLQRSNSLEIQVELLCSTLRVDAALLKVGEVGESFDTAGHERITQNNADGEGQALEHLGTAFESPGDGTINVTAIRTQPLATPPAATSTLVLCQADPRPRHWSAVALEFGVGGIGMIQQL